MDMVVPIKVSIENIDHSDPRVKNSNNVKKFYPSNFPMFVGNEHEKTKLSSYLR